MFRRLSLRTIVALFALGIVPIAQAALDVSGYFDMEFVMEKRKEPYFRQHHLNLLLQHSVGIYKFMAEIEFEDAVDLDYGRTPVTSNTKTKTGRLFVERAWGEAAFSRWANLRIGQLLHSSYYYQNHYPSITANFTDPATRKKIFDYNIKGARLWAEADGIYYDVWTGRGPSVSSTTSTASPNNENGQNFGGKLGYTLTLPNSSVTLSYMTARYSNGLGIRADKSNGVELVANIGKLNLLSEYGIREDGATNNNDEKAGYLITSYSVDLGSNGELLPFLMGDTYKLENQYEAKKRYAVGAAFRPLPTITYKAEFLVTPAYKTTSTTTVKETNQVALAFVYFYN